MQPAQPAMSPQATTPHFKRLLTSSLAGAQAPARHTARKNARHRRISRNRRGLRLRRPAGRRGPGSLGFAAAKRGEEAMAEAGRIRAGVGGWTFEPWRGVFYPKGLKQAAELEYASRHLTAIEINGTYYSTFKPDSFAKWRAATPDGFKFTVKASRFCTNRKVLADMGQSMQVFLNQGLVELGDRLGPILWQFMGTKKFEPDDFEGFLKLLPSKLEGLPLAHVVEPRHASFKDPAFVALCRKYGVAICLADHATYPLIPDVAGDVVYARLQAGSDEIETAYPPAEIDRWAERLQTYAEGGAPADLPRIAAEGEAPQRPREVFAFFIHEGKVRAPAAAMALLERVGQAPAEA
jgi:uncharacterized protein YecE (DUF72 family)